MPFKSTQPDIRLPTDLSIWDWLFDSSSSVLNRHSPSELRGYSNGITGERIDYGQVKEASTFISTALAKKYGMKEGEPVAIFSPNNIWYPVAMVRVSELTATMRAANGLEPPAWNPSSWYDP